MLKQQIKKDLKSALKAKESLKVSTLRMILAAIVNKKKQKRAEIAEGEELSEKELSEKSQLNKEEIIEVLSKQAKNRREAIEGFKKGGRQDLVEKEQKELKIIQQYLPEQLSEKEIKDLAQQVIEQVGAEGMKDMGKVMGILMPKVKGRASGGKVSTVVKQLLQS